MTGLIFKRALASRSSGEWNDDDFERRKPRLTLGTGTRTDQNDTSRQFDVVEICCVSQRPLPDPEPSLFFGLFEFLDWLNNWAPTDPKSNKPEWLQAQEKIWLARNK
jgi:hypothetical protein